MQARSVWGVPWLWRRQSYMVDVTREHEDNSRERVEGTCFDASPATGVLVTLRSTAWHTLCLVQDDAGRTIVTKDHQQEVDE